MTVDLTGGLDPSREFVYASCPPEPGVKESVSMWISDDRGELGIPQVALEGMSPDWDSRVAKLTVGFPDGPANAAEAVYVFAHEAVGPIANAAVGDNTPPSEKRSGVADRYSSAAAVRGGLLLLERTAPELADGYARYYLRVAKVPGSESSPNPRAQLATAFPLPEGLRDALGRQLEVVLGGI